MSELAPEGWKWAYLGDTCKFTGGSAFKEKYQGNKNGDYPFIKVSDMNLPENGKYIYAANNWINEDIKIEAKTKLFPNGSVVFAKVGAALFLNRRRILSRDTAIDNNMMAAMPHSIDNIYLYHTLNNIDFADFAQDGAVPSINQSQMENIQALLPPLPEQEKIAEILTSVDDVIEKSQAQIDKLQDLKKATMNQLLTRGINHTEFKDSPLGKIPKGWTVEKLSDISARITKGATPTTYGFDWQTSGIVFLKSESVKKDAFSFAGAKFISQEAHDAMERSKIVGGDILISITGYIGSACIYPYMHPEANINQHIARVRVKTQNKSRYVMHFLNTERQLREFLSIQTGQAYPQLSLKQIQDTVIAFPKPDELEKIVNTIDSMGRNIEEKQRKLEHTKALKKSLMQDLLTGKKRVKVA
ncbi:MAG: hypothetical protein HON65_11280 [Rhodospirillales bacterium]|jgi:type I restriction enzyme, S subunit|nr:hypothetical protein [Rhodospirillales bacterium]